MYKEKRVGASNDDEVGEGDSSTDEDEEGMSLRGGTEEGRGRPKLAEQLKRAADRKETEQMAAISRECPCQKYLKDVQKDETQRTKQMKQRRATYMETERRAWERDQHKLMEPRRLRQPMHQGGVPDNLGLDLGLTV